MPSHVSRGITGQEGDRSPKVLAVATHASQRGSIAVVLNECVRKLPRPKPAWRNAVHANSQRRPGSCESSNDIKTVQVGIGQVMDSLGATNWGGIMAAGVLAISPVVLMFSLVQKALIQGLTAGAVKG